MAKDSYWFRHDSTAGRAIKMRKMAHIYGHWGKGVYWDVVEILRDQEKYTFECDESSLQLLCDLIGCKDEKRFLSWFMDSLRLGLFDANNVIFECPPLSESMGVWETKKNNGSKGGRPSKIKVENLIESESKANQNHNSTVQNNTEQNNKREFDVFILDVSKHRQWSESFYMQFKVSKGSLKTLLNKFVVSLGLKDEKDQPKDIAKFKTHFINWCNVQERIGTLTEYKKNKSKVKGAL